MYVVENQPLRFYLVEAFSGEDVVLPEYELETNWFHKINAVSTAERRQKVEVRYCYRTRETPSASIVSSGY